MLFSTNSAIAFSGLLCDSAMIVIAFQSSPIFSRPRVLVGSPWSWSRIRVVNRRSSLFAPPNSAAQRARERIGDVAARKGRIETAVHRG